MGSLVTRKNRPTESEPIARLVWVRVTAGLCEIGQDYVQFEAHGDGRPASAAPATKQGNCQVERSRARTTCRREWCDDVRGQRGQFDQAAQ